MTLGPGGGSLPVPPSFSDGRCGDRLTRKESLIMAAPKKAAEQKDGAKLVKMVRDAEQYPAPHEAEVHPAEVDNYAAGGWEKA